MLTNSEKTEVAKLYASTCKAFDKILDADVLRMQVEDLCDLEYLKIIQAFEIYRKDSRNITWPRANRIRDLINRKQSNESLANECASRIRSAVTKFGWPNEDLAKAYVGELGWKIVERSGGWMFICQNLGVELNLLTFHAQARDLAKSMLESNTAGNFDQPIALPSSKEKEQLTQVQNLLTLKELPK